MVYKVYVLGKTGKEGKMIVSMTNGKNKLILKMENSNTMAVGQTIHLHGDKWIVVKISPLKG